ncbi:DUF4352 domain-containing protein [Acidithiobacillus sp.]
MGDAFQTFHTRGQFIIVVVAMKNEQKSAITVGDSEFILVSPDGTRYSTSDDDIYLPHAAGILNQLNPGIIRVMEVAFNVPKELSPRGLRLRVQGGMTGNRAYLPLRPSVVGNAADQGTPPHPHEPGESTSTAEAPSASSHTTVIAPNAGEGMKLAAEYQMVTARLGSVYADKLHKLSSTSAPDLKSNEIAWIIAKRKACGTTAYAMQQGHEVALDCLIRKTTERLQYLENLRGG